MKILRFNSGLYSVVVMFLSAVFAGCAADPFEVPNPSGENNISFTRNVKPIVTRGTLANLASIESFGVSAAIYPAGNGYSTAGCGSYFRDVEVDTDDGSINYLWPSSDYRLSFYAYTPYGAATLSAAETAGKMQYIYTVPDAVASHIDFMTAEMLDVTCPSEDPVALTFTHALSDFKFRLENSTNQDVTVNSITIKNFDHTGTLNGDTWTTTGATRDFTLAVGQELASGSSLDLTGTNNHFILIPQTITSGKRLLDLYVTSGGEDQHFYSDLTQDFVAEIGKSYQFTLRLSSNLEVSQGTTIADWVLYVGYINYATGTSTEDWSPEDQPIEHVVSGIANWQQQN